PGKTPISLLQEYGTRIGKTPGYDLLKAEGQAHQPNFTFRVTVGDISCTGGSPTRHLPLPGFPRRGERRLGWGIPWDPDPWDTQGSPDTLIPPGCDTGTLPGTPTSRMRRRDALAPRKLMVQKGWRLPEYTVTQESGPAHRKEFTMTCRVERFVEIGSGTSKKLAKRNAAAKMLVRIHNVPMEPREGSEAEAEEDQFSMVPASEGLPGGRGHPGVTPGAQRGDAGTSVSPIS
ncbi:TRBP2 protein, partial [Scopus umbretta]|nr:TRBP2 protein [Scopus umbretta]